MHQITEPTSNKPTKQPNKIIQIRTISNSTTKARFLKNKRHQSPQESDRWYCLYHYKLILMSVRCSAKAAALCRFMSKLVCSVRFRGHLMQCLRPKGCSFGDSWSSPYVEHLAHLSARISSQQTIITNSSLLPVYSQQIAMHFEALSLARNWDEASA